MDEVIVWGIVLLLFVAAVLGLVLYIRWRRRLFAETPTKTPTTRLQVEQYGGGGYYPTQRSPVPTQSTVSTYQPVVIYESDPGPSLDVGSLFDSSSSSTDTSSSDSSSFDSSSSSDGGDFSGGGGGESGGGGASGEI